MKTYWRMSRISRGTSDGDSSRDAMERFEEEDAFLDRQLNETQYLSRTARTYLAHLYNEKARGQLQRCSRDTRQDVRAAQARLGSERAGERVGRRADRAQTARRSSPSRDGRLHSGEYDAGIASKIRSRGGIVLAGRRRESGRTDAQTMGRIRPERTEGPFLEKTGYFAQAG